MCIPEATDDSAAPARTIGPRCHSCARSWPNRAWRWTPCRWACPPTLELAVACGSTLVRVGTAIFVAARRVTLPDLHPSEFIVMMHITFIGGGNMATAIIAGLTRPVAARSAWSSPMPTSAHSWPSSLA